MNKKKSEKGQALVLLALAIVGLVGITGLAIDGGNAYSDKRNAQNAADSAALAGALAKVRGQNPVTAAQARAATNGYDNNVTPGMVVVNNPPQVGCDGTTSTYAGNSEYVQVLIHSDVETYFAPVVGIQEMNNCVEAIARATPPTVNPLFFGNAVVGLNPNTNHGGSFPCGFDSGNSNAAEWTLTGGGIFSNGCAYSKNNDSVHLPTNPAKCVTTVGPAYNFTCMQPNQASLKFSSTDIAALMPPPPACDNTQDGGYVVPINPSNFTFSNGIYCVSNFDAFRQRDIVLDNATLYVTDTNFDLKFAGHGGFAGTAPTTGPYKGYYLIIAISSNPCERYQDKNVQSMEFRGNGNTGIVGSILAPTACIDFRGNANGVADRTQVIGYNVTSNGNAELHINYNADDNAKAPVPPKIELTK